MGLLKTRFPTETGVLVGSNVTAGVVAKKVFVFGEMYRCAIHCVGIRIRYICSVSMIYAEL